MNKMKKSAMLIVLTFMLTLALPEIVTSISGTTNVEAAVKRVSLNKKSIKVKAGNKAKLKLKNAKAKKVKWKSSKKSVAKISSKGVVTGVKKGNAVITAKYKGKKYKCNVKVYEPIVIALDSISLNKDNLNLIEGDKSILIVTYNPDNTTANKYVQWSSSDNNVATVDEKGLVCAKNEGTTIITANVDGKTATCKVIVNKATVRNIEKLKSYIQTYGECNKDGDRFITAKGKYENVEFQFAIIKDHASGKLEFAYIANFEPAETGIVMQLDTENTSNNYLEYMIVYKYASAAAKANAVIDAKTYKEGDIISFNFESMYGRTESDYQQIANAELKLAFSGWNELLQKNVGLSLRDIGFLAY